MGKAADNEARKLRATYYNNIGIGLLIAGVLIPYLALVQRADEFLTWMDSVIGGTATITKQQAFKFAFTFAALLLAAQGAKYFRRLAREEIAKVED